MVDRDALDRERSLQARGFRSLAATLGRTPAAPLEYPALRFQRERQTFATPRFVSKWKRSRVCRAEEIP
jgi:hypothetical protein